MRKIRHGVHIVTSPGQPTRSHGVPLDVDIALPKIMAPEHRTVVLVGLEQSRRGAIATDEEVRAVFASFRQ